MKNHKSTWLNENGYVKSTYSFLFYILGLWSPMSIIMLKSFKIMPIYLVIVVLVSILSLIPFIIMRMALKFLQIFIDNTLLKFILWLLVGEMLAFLFYAGIVIREELFDWNKFAAWHVDTFVLVIFFIPHYTTVLLSFLVEFYYKDTISLSNYNKDILDDVEEEEW